jgi:hypothetical protein
MKKCFIALLSLLSLSSCAESPQQPSWQYSVVTDKMKQESVPFAFIKSQEIYQLKFPNNGGTHGIVIVDKVNAHYRLGFGLDRGQIQCKSQCAIRLRFDNDPPQTALFQHADAIDKSSIVALDSLALLAQLAAAKALVVELPVANNGVLQFSFDTAGFDPAKVEAPPKLDP